MKTISMAVILTVMLMASSCATLPIIDASRAGKLDEVKALVNAGEDVNQDYSGHTALYAASDRGNIEIVKYLIDKGADLEKAPFGDTPLAAALESKRMEVAEVLVNAGASVDSALYTVAGWFLGDPSGGGSMFRTDKEQVDAGRFLVHSGADVNYMHSKYNGNTALHWVATKGNRYYLFADFLIKSGADHTIKNKHGLVAYNLCRNCGPGMSKIVMGITVD